MKLESILAAASALALAVAATASAAAQSSAQKAAPAAPARKYDISKEVQKPLFELQTAVKEKKYENFDKLLAAVQAVAKNKDEKYAVAKLRLQHALDTKNVAGQTAAIDAILASGGADAAEATYFGIARGDLAFEAKNYAAAEAAYAPYIATETNNLNLALNMAVAKMELRKEAEVLPLLQRAIGIAKAQGKKGQEGWYQKALELAVKQNNMPLAVELSREALSAYPTEVNLRNRVVVYQRGARLDPEAQLDLLRLMRVTKALNGPKAYLELASLMAEQRLFGEAKAVLDEGRTLGLGSAGATLLADVNRQIAAQRAELPSLERDARAAANGRLAINAARAYFGYGDYAKAAELYRLALTKGGTDSGVINTRLGIALAYAGQKAEAQAAFKAVTGARAELASLWLAWLNQRA